MDSVSEAGLKERLKNVPLKPGVYIFKDSAGTIIYVGKAKALRNRMRSYFQAPDRLHPKVRAMMNRVHSFDFIVTDTEVEALILENNLIKANQPRYNIDLRDDKTYPWLKITVAEPFPRILITREKKDGVSMYFGPYTDVGSLRETVRLLTSIFPLRTCKSFKTGQRACLNYDLHRCMAPCKGEVSADEYRLMVDKIIAFLQGDNRAILKQKEEEMKQAASNLEFEKAARLRDQITAINKLAESQKVELARPLNLDMVGLLSGEKESLALVFKIRSGRIIAKDTFWLNRVFEEDEGELAGFFLRQYYANNNDIPGEIIINVAPADQDLIKEWLKIETGRSVTIKVPQRGERRKLLDMMMENIRLLWEEKHDQDVRARELLMHLGRVLDLEILPQRIECYDISHLGGDETVASMVVFCDGLPYNAGYRRFKMKLDRNDDYDSLRETLRRRFTQARAGNPAFLPEPDLILIDGGLGQVNAAKGVLDEMGVDIALFSLAEKREEIYRPGTGQPLVLERRDEALKLLQRIRDEAHRFAIEYNRQRRSKKMTVSALDNIEGIGPGRRRNLLRHFGSSARIGEASVEELAAVPGMNRAVAQKVYEYFHTSGGFPGK